MKRYTPPLLAAAFAVCASVSPAQVSYTGQSYSQNFNGLAGTANNTLNVGWTDNTTLPGWYSTQTAYHVTNGTVGGTAATFDSTSATANNVGLFSFGAAASTERALGSRATSNFPGNDPIRRGVRLVNNTGTTLTKFSILYTGEQWFNSSAAVAHALTVDYQIGASNLSAGTWTSVPALSFTSPVITATPTALDGNAAANRAAKVALVSGVSWAPGQELWIRFNDLNETGNEQGLAVDDFTFWTGEDQALYFDGANDYVTMGPATSTLGASVFTLECWFLRTGAGVTASTGSGGVSGVPLVTKGRGESDGTNLDCNYFLGIDASGRLVADFEAAPATGITAGQNYPITGVAVAPMNVWNHAAVTYSGTTWKLYLNGVLDATSTPPAGAGPRADSIQHFGIGTAMNSTGAAAGFFQGVIDEVRVWNVARTAAEIQANKDFPITSPVAGLRARYGLNEGAGTTTAGLVAGAPAGTLTNGPVWVQGPTLVPNSNQPTVINAVSPADNATGIGASTTLSVSLADAEGDAMTVTFYGTNTAPVTPGPDFAIGTLPDTQYYSQNTGGTRAATFYGQTQWYVDNRDVLNLAFVSHMGDIVQDGDFGGNPEQWIVADTAMRKIEDPVTTMRTHGIPWGAAPGNHDQTPIGSAIGTTTFYNQYFGTARYAGRPYFGGNYGTNNDNNYQFFSASGLDFIIIHLEYDARAASNYQAVLDWADSVLKAYPDRRAIVTSHWIVNTGNPATFSTQGQAIYDNLKDNPNLFLLLCGHVAGEGRRSDVFEGRTVHSVLQDYQGRANGGDGWLRYFVFSPANNTITAKTYSPKLGTSETDADSQFVLSYDMQSTVTGWIPLGTVNVPSGGTAANLNWTGLESDSDYAWYASVSDGINTSATAPRYFFTSTTQNAAPTVTLTAPASGATYTAPASITINATASDTDGTVTKVDFYQGANFIGTDTTSPYSYTWGGVAAGSYSLTARATDNGGAITTSTAIPVTVTGGATVVSLQQGANGYAGMVDSHIRFDAQTTNYGTSTAVWTDGSPDQSALLKWDLSSIPAGKTVTAVTLTFNVTNLSPHVYEFYALKRAWSESATTWVKADATVNWQTAGASGANDRETTVLGTLTAAAMGTKTITLNAAGIAKVQAWVNTPSTNYGFIVQDYTVTDGLYVTSSEGATVSQRPIITVTYQ